MKKVFRKFSISILVSVIACMSGYSYVSAEDIVIFQRDATVPNVLFVVDTSGSMAEPVDPANPSGPSRLEAMQSAFATVLGETYETLNVGFMDFQHFTGSGVDLPVTSVNQLAQNVEPGVVDATETYAQLLTRGVNALTTRGKTPTVEALYEAALYFRGAEPFEGDQLDVHTSWDDVNAEYEGGHWTSAGLRTYENGTIQQTPTNFCLNGPGFEGNNHSPCGSRPIDPTTCETYTDFMCPVARTCTVQPVPLEGCPSTECPQAEVEVTPERCRLLRDVVVGSNYISPIQDPCTSNHIVLLSDGKPTEDSGGTQSGIRSLTSKTSCDSLALLGITDSEILDTGECGVDLVDYLYTTDQSSSSAGTNQPGLQTIQTHAIGFQLDAGSDGAKFLDEIAKAGGTGAFIDASDPSTLVSALQAIVSAAIGDEPRIISRIATTPDLTNLGATRPEVYMPLFSVVDTAANPVFDATGSFINNTSSFWSNNDGNIIDQGGLVGILPNPGSRNLVTDDGAGNLIALESGVTALNSNPLNIFGAGLSTAQIDELIDWINGEDVFDEDNDATTTKRNYVGDALHSNPVVVSYDETGSDGVIDRAVTFFMTNEGILHAIDDNYFVDKSTNSAAEIFAYMPRGLLKNIQTLEMNTDNTGKIYGLDGPLVFHQDGGARNLAGNKYLFFGMRRGGNNYYGMDVTDPDNPVLMWTIEGGSSGFEELAQTWSTPIVTEVDDGGTVKTALVFGGGYDVDQDMTNTFTVDDEGRAIFIVDAMTGAKLWSAGPAGAAHNLELGMTNAVAADPAVIDFENDGLIDRLYFADVGGHIWRIDIEGDISDPSNTSGYLFADLHDGTVAGNRRFFSRPSAAFTQRGSLAVSIGSGNRVNPLQGADNIDRVTDRFYTLFDPYPGKLDIPTTTPAAILDSNLQDLTGFSAGFDTSGLVGGWRVDLLTDEKVFNSPRVILGEIFFNTYVPPTNSCSSEPDGSNLYVLSLDGEPTRDLDATTISTKDAFVAIRTTGLNGEIVITVAPDGNKVFGHTGPNSGIPLIDKVSLDDLSWTNNPPPPPVVTP